MPITRYGFDVNQPGASVFSRFATRTQAPYKTGIVVDIILGKYNPDGTVHPDWKEDGSNVGFAKVRIVPFDNSDSEENLNWIAPIETSIQQYPLMGEVVQVTDVGGSLKYKLININNKITINTSSTIQVVSDLSREKQDADIEASLVSSGVRTTNTTEPYRTNELILPLTRALQPKQGDMLIQGRFGNSIRFGSSKFQPRTTLDNAPSPNLLLTVGSWVAPSEDGVSPQLSTGDTLTEYSLTYEDINNNSTCLWMVANQLVDFKASTKDSPAHLRGSEIQRISPWYTGAQIFANSDRVVINSKKNEIALFSKTEINLSAIQTISISSEKNINVGANLDIILNATDDMFIKGKNVSLIAKQKFSNNVNGTYTILGKKIFIGATEGDTSQPMVLGGTLSVWLQRLLDVILSPGLVITPTGPATLNPAQTLILQQLRQSLGGTFPQSAVFNSKDNFTSENNFV